MSEPVASTLRRSRQRTRPSFWISRWRRNPWFWAGLAAALGTAWGLIPAARSFWVTMESRRALPEASSGSIRDDLSDAADSLREQNAAERLEAEGRFADAEEHWRAAMTLQPARADVLRRAIRCALTVQPPDGQLFRDAFGAAGALMAITRTNVSAVETLSEVCDHFQRDGILTEITDALPFVRSPSIEGRRAKAFFRLGDSRKFQESMVRAHGSNDPELPLFGMAGAALWARESDAGAARRELEQCATNGAGNLAAERLLLVVLKRRGDAAGFGAWLARAEERETDRPADHLAYWTLLAMQGRKDEAAVLAHRYARPPRSASELVALAQGFSELGLDDDAITVLTRFSPKVAADTRLSMLLSELLIKNERWEDLRRLAFRIRDDPESMATLGAYGCYLDALAGIKTGDTPYAQKVMSDAPQMPIADDAMALLTARKLLSIGGAGPARDILARRRASMGGSTEFWTLFLQVAVALRDTELLCEAARQRLMLEPQSVAAANDLCAALLAAGGQAGEALPLARRVFAERPNSSTARFNMGLALVQSGEPLSAEVFLSGLETKDYSPMDLTLLGWARAEAAFASGDVEKASAILGPLDPALLFSGQQVRFDRFRSRVERARRGP